ncbi:MAG: hypothetical protein ACO4CT_16415, partial [Planctomycetota bacterium]
MQAAVTPGSHGRRATGRARLHLGRLEGVVREHAPAPEALAIAVQGAVHQLALGGYGLSLQHC